MKTFGHVLKEGPATTPLWKDIAPRFSKDEDCLAAFVTWQAAEILAGAKPANMVNMVNMRPPCSRDFRALWQKHGRELINKSRLEAFELVDRGNSLLILLYDPDLLENLISCRNAAGLLRKAGYKGDLDLESVLNELRSRVSSGGFPHEIGIILGYPLKDVAGYMGLARIPFACQGPWKIYGDPCKSLELAEAHRKCRCRMSIQLASGVDPYERLRVRPVKEIASCSDRTFSLLNN